MHTTRIFRLVSVLFLAAVMAGCAVDGEPVDSANHEISGRAYFELSKGIDGQFYFNLTAANHEVILASEGYTRREGALGGVLSVLNNGGLANHYDLRRAVNGQYYFVLKAGNGQIIGTSEMYEAKQGAQRGVSATIGAVANYLAYQSARTGARFDVFEGNDGQFYFNLHADNGAIVLASQGYSSEAAALNGAFSVVDNGVDAAHYDLRQAADGGFYFNLMATNGQVIGTSEVYASFGNAERARDAIIALLPQIELL